jgi:hypothetical protein
VKQTEQIQTELLASLMSYGLNPYEWTLRFHNLSQFKTGIQKVVIENKNDSSFRFLGSAQIKSFGSLFKGRWLQLAVCE